MDCARDLYVYDAWIFSVFGRQFRVLKYAFHERVAAAEEDYISP
jgi:hypothetical protein